MRIPNGYSTYRSEATTKVTAPGSTSRSGATGAAAAEPSEKVTLSADAQRAAAQSENAKVERLRSAVQDGSLKVDTKAIASRIVEGG